MDAHYAAPDYSHRRLLKLYRYCLSNDCCRQCLGGEVARAQLEMAWWVVSRLQVNPVAVRNP